jgi:putative ABC transport system ATP-binding protein
MYLLEVKNLKKVYTTRFGGNAVKALNNVSFTVDEGEMIAIMGESGSGKTTLLNMIAALDKPTGGEVYLNGKNITVIGDKEISSFRRENLGFVFQDFNLLDTFSIQDNIFLPLVLAGTPYEEMNKRLTSVAKRLRITDLLSKYPYEVSGGEKQRTAVARALITHPKLTSTENRKYWLQEKLIPHTAFSIPIPWTVFRKTPYARDFGSIPSNPIAL